MSRSLSTSQGIIKHRLVCGDGSTVDEKKSRGYEAYEGAFLAYAELKRKATHVNE